MNLRKRRTKLKLDNFHIVTQVGQGGYGEVYLARHKETNQVVALKKMKKRTLAKMDEVHLFPLALFSPSFFSLNSDRMNSRFVTC